MRSRLEIDPFEVRQKTYDLLLRVRPPTPYEQTVLGSEYVFLPTEAKSLKVVVAENLGCFSDYARDFVSREPNVSEYIPPEMIVGINPREFVIPGSFGKSQAEQLKMIERQSKAVQRKLPNARVMMLPVSTYAQADLVFQKTTGQKLFWAGDFFIRALDATRVGACDIGRLNPDGPLYIGDFDVRYGIPNFLCAVAAVVFVAR